MQLFMLFIDSNDVYVSGVTRPSSGAQELCIRHAKPQYVHGTEAKITAIGRHTQDRIQSHTRKQQTTPPRNNQEGKRRR